MVKKELTNKKVVRAIALGLSAVMLTTPMTAMAHEANEGGEGTGTGSQNPTPVNFEQTPVATENYETADAAIDTAQEKTQAAITEINSEDLNGDITGVILKDNDQLSNKEETTIIPNQKVGNDSGNLEVVGGATDTSVEIPSYDESDFDAIGETVKGAAADLNTAEITLGAAANAETMAKDLVDNTIEPAISDINDKNVAINEAVKAADDNAKLAETAAQAADAAQTQEAAQAAIDDAKAAWDAAKDAQMTAEALVEENKAALEEVEKEVVKAELALEAAKAAVGTTKTELESAEKALKDAEIAAKEIADELAASEEKLTAATGEVAATKEECLLLAYNKMKNTAKGNIWDVYNKQDKTKVDIFEQEVASSAYWSDSLEYFKLYIQYMYDDKTDVTYSWFEVSNDDRAEEKNTYIVTYMDGDTKVEKMFNYHVVDTEGNIEIYEKDFLDRQVPDGTITVPKYAETNVVKVGNGWVEYDASTHGNLYTDANNNSYVKVGEAKQERVQGIEGTPSNEVPKFENAQIVTKDGQTMLQVPVEATVTVAAGYKAEEYTGSKDTITCGSYMNQLFPYREYAEWMLKQKLVDLDLVPTENWMNVVINNNSGKGNPNGSSTVSGAEGIKVKVYQTSKGQGWNKVYYWCYEITFEDDVKKQVWQNGGSSPKTVAYDYYATSEYKAEGAQIGTKEEPKTKTEYYWTESLSTGTAGVADKDTLTTFIDGIKAKVDGLSAEVSEKKAQAAKAQEAVKLAKEAVMAAKGALEEVMTDMSATETEVANARAAYVTALGDYNEAVEEAKEIAQDVADAEEAYNDAQAELDRFVDDGSDDSSSDDDDTTPVVTPIPTPAVLVDASVAPVAVVAPVAAAPAVVDIEDEATPLAGGIGDGDGNDGAGNGDDEVIVAEAQEEAPAIVAIEDEETPLAAGVGADGKMSWWWLLIVALLGATGYKMYKDHQKKKEEAQEA